MPGDYKPPFQTQRSWRHFNFLGEPVRKTDSPRYTLPLFAISACVLPSNPAYSHKEPVVNQPANPIMSGRSAANTKDEMGYNPYRTTEATWKPSLKEDLEVIGF